jgi:hypothetical protein
MKIKWWFLSLENFHLNDMMTNRYISRQVVTSIGGFLLGKEVCIMLCA